ncbi:TadE/TadG family type IV pilus assembly protein [Rhizorhabdus argentea]|uniref:TadE/TadG family type IV pilus assembly protein n=1 Tax=Rhizorhabdus argentea TaxID=1387174 RepID=UPI0030EEA6A4
MNAFLTRFARSTNAATAAEFALVLPLLLLFLIGIIYVGALMWTWNRAEKATQMGVRFAVVTDLVPSGLAGINFMSSPYNCSQGNNIPVSSAGSCAFSATITCQSGGCSSYGYDGTAFNNIVLRMQAFMPEIQPANVQVIYQHVGLGYAGDPNGPDISPLVTVRLRDMTFAPGFAAMFGSLTLPDFSAALTMEDSSGSTSN